ncbi:hypothetical protein [Azospirillum sp. B506]|uniref:hypothetical protein n=1 Tax=Azospirillum sp. B506 TaxID=137721 RepID=UPI0003449B85|nr:hypothetical protein [Azospirillum sp. B506]
MIAGRQPTVRLPEPGAFRRGVLAQVLERVDASFRRGPPEPVGFLEAVRAVIVVASASRSGSSLFVELLKGAGGLLHLSGELNPFLRLAGLGWPDSGCDSDTLHAAHCTDAALRILRQHLAAEVGFIGDEIDPVAPLDDVFLERLYRRLCLQWPYEAFAIDSVRRSARCAVGAVASTTGRPLDWTRDLSSFHLFLLAELRTAHPTINPYYYDLDRSLIGRIWPDLPVPSGPPSPVVVEEPPFVLIHPWRRCSVADLRARALVVKAPSNAYRPDFLRRLFPSASFRTLHLTRNPAASINGIHDGWRHWGFHSHYIGSELRLRGYARPGEPDHGWWKFDLPPAWQAYREAPLERVCGFQWCAAHQAILQRYATEGGDRLRVRFEDVLTGFTARPDDLHILRAWVGDDGLLARGLGGVQPVMSTQPPRAGRWREKTALLRGVLNEEAVRQMALQLGYEDEAEWI